MNPSHAPFADPAQCGSPICPSASTLVIVRLRPAQATADDIRRVAERVRELFVGMPGLQRKYFSYSPERHEVVNVYVWHDSSAAAQVRDPEFLAKIRAVYAGEPDVTFAEILAIAEPAVACGRDDASVRRQD